MVVWVCMVWSGGLWLYGAIWYGQKNKTLSKNWKPAGGGRARGTGRLARFAHIAGSGPRFCALTMAVWLIVVLGYTGAYVYLVW